jgi:hypothetical protein
MPVVLPFFAFALPFCASALKVFDRKGGSARRLRNSKHRRRVVPWKATPHGEKNTISEMRQRVLCKCANILWMCPRNEPRAFAWAARNDRNQTGSHDGWRVIASSVRKDLRRRRRLSGTGWPCRASCCTISDAACNGSPVPGGSGIRMDFRLLSRSRLRTSGDGSRHR